MPSATSGIAFFRLGSSIPFGLARSSVSSMRFSSSGSPLAWIFRRLRCWHWLAAFFFAPRRTPWSGIASGGSSDWLSSARAVGVAWCFCGTMRQQPRRWTRVVVIIAAIEFSTHDAQQLLDRTAASLCSRMVRIIYQRLLQPPGRFRRRSLDVMLNSERAF